MKLDQFSRFYMPARFYLFALSLTVGLSLFNTPASLAAPMDMALKHYQQGDYPMAAEYFGQAIRHDGNNANARYYLADSLLKMNRLIEAKEAYEQAIAIAPDSPAGKMSKAGLVEIKTRLNPPETSVIVSATASLKTAGRSGPDKLESLFNTGSSYIDEVVEGGQMARWSVLKMPIRLWVDKSPVGVGYFQQGFPFQVKKAMDQWVTALNNEVEYVLVDTPDQADIRVSWINTIDTKGFKTDTGITYTAGVTVPNIVKEQLVTMDVRLSTFDIKGQPQGQDEIYLLALHELGHALGIRGHSQDPKDIMFAQNQGIQKLSTRDINTIRQLYGQEVDITSLPQDKTKLNDTDRLKKVGDKIDLEIAKMETLVKTNGTHLNFNNLGSSYFQRGKMLKKEGKTAEAQAFYDKAIKSFDTALNLEPNSASTLYNRCIVREETKEFELALSDIDKAIRLDGRESKYFLERTFVLTNMRKKAEALAALEDYLTRDPQQVNSEPVQKVRRILAKF